MINTNLLVKLKCSAFHLSGLVTSIDEYSPKPFFFFLIRYDHLKKEAIEFKVWEPDKNTEVYRRALEEACTSYTQDHYKTATCSVFSSSQDNNITLTACIEGHQFQAKNFW